MSVPSDALSHATAGSPHAEHQAGMEARLLQNTTMFTDHVHLCLSSRLQERQHAEHQAEMEAKARKALQLAAAIRQKEVRTVHCTSLPCQWQCTAHCSLLPG